MADERARYEIKLRLSYQYDAVVAGGRHLVRVQPRTLPGIQTVTVANVGITPQPAERWEGVDFFGNNTATLVYTGPHTELEVLMTAQVGVERTARQVIGTNLDLLPQEIGAVRSLAPEAPHHFLHDSRRVQVDDTITAYARNVPGPVRDVFQIAWKLCTAIKQDFAYQPGATDVGTPTIEAFNRKTGVCQDFAHVMIAGLRGLGIPAGYVSGFIRTIPPEGQKRLEGADAMHAWCRVWCGAAAGWQEFDPTNAIAAGPDHIVIGYGRDYADISPIVGVLRSAGGQRSTQAVDVIPLEAV